MAEIGHADPKVTLSIYAHVMRRGPEAKEGLRALVEGTTMAPAEAHGPTASAAASGRAADARS